MTALFTQSPPAARDFTVNALYYCPRHGQVLDFVGGVPDLQRRTLRLSSGPRGGQVRAPPRRPACSRARASTCRARRRGADPRPADWRGGPVAHAHCARARARLPWFAGGAAD